MDRPRPETNLLAIEAPRPDTAALSDPTIEADKAAVSGLGASMVGSDKPAISGLGASPTTEMPTTTAEAAGTQSQTPAQTMLVPTCTTRRSVKERLGRIPVHNRLGPLIPATKKKRYRKERKRPLAVRFHKF